MATFDYRTGGSTEYYECPQGDMISSSDVYEWVESSSDRTIFCARNDFRQIPGENKSDCNGVWVHEWTDYVQERWGVSDLPDPTVTEERPDGGKDGTETLSLAITESGAEVGWSYTQPNVHRDDNSTAETAEWYWDHQDWDASSDTNVWETGSECEFSAGSSPDFGDRLLEIIIAHTFTDYYTTSADTNSLRNTFDYE